MTVSVINAGKLHNMVPNTCTFTIDVRTTDQYTNREVLEIIQQNIKVKLKPEVSGSILHLFLWNIPL